MEWHEIKMNKKHADWILATRDNTFNILEGGVRSGKTTSLILAFCRNLERLNRGGLHLAFAESISLARMILMEGGSELGIKGYFAETAVELQYKGKDALHINIRGHEHIVIFVGSSKANSFKSIRGLTITSVIGTEVSLAHETFMEEVLARTLMTEPKYRKYFLDTNPTLDTHYIYVNFIDRWIKESKEGKLLGGVNYETVSLYENPALTKEQAEIIASQYDITSNFYKALILGMRVNYLDTVYTLYDYNLKQKEEMPKPPQYIITVDVGFTNSATTFVAGGKGRDGKLYIYDSYYHRNGNEEEGNKKETKDYALDLVKFYKQLEERFGFPAREVLIDRHYAVMDIFEEVFIENKISKHKLDFVIKDKIEERITQTRNLLYTGEVIIDESLEEVKRALKNGVYDSKEKDKGKLVRLDNTNLEFNPVDVLDALEYLVSYYVRY